MAAIDIGAGALGARVRAGVSVIPPGGWVGAVALAGVLVLAWHFWDRDVEDTTSWTDPEQPPPNLPLAKPELPDAACGNSGWFGLSALRARRCVGPDPGAC